MAVKVSRGALGKNSQREYSTREVFIGIGGDALLQMGPLPKDFYITKGCFCSSFGALTLTAKIQQGLQVLSAERPMSDLDKAAMPCIDELKQELIQAMVKFADSLQGLMNEIQSRS